MESSESRRKAGEEKGMAVMTNNWQGCGGWALTRNTPTAIVGRGPMWSLVTTEQTDRLQVASELPLAECFLF